MQEYYTSGGVLSGNSEGRIYTIDNNHGDARVVELRKILMDKRIGYCDIISYAQITYTDVFDNKHVDYFKTNPGVSKISEVEWKKNDSIRGDFKHKRFYLRETSIAEILNLLPK